jgi:hypothetical protein
MAITNTAKVQMVLVRLVQVCFAVFYLYLGLVYVGMVVLVPLGAFYHVFNILHLILPGLLAAPAAAGLVAGAGVLLYKVPKVWESIQEAGLKLLDQAMAQLHEFGTLARALNEQADGGGTGGQV